MAFPNVSDIVATTIQKRNKKIANNVLGHNAVLSLMNKAGRVKTFSGGEKIYEELSFAENGNAGFYSGYDPLPTAAQDVISAAEYEIKQAAVAISMSGLEGLQNAGPEKFIDLMEGRVEVGEDTLKNLIATSIYHDGTTAKELDGLGKFIVNVPATGTVGNINAANYSFWRNKYQQTAGATSQNLVDALNVLWPQLVRGSDKPDLIVLGTTLWQRYVSILQTYQRFASDDKAGIGFPTLKFMGSCDVTFDSVSTLGALEGYILNSKFLKFRPHAERNFVALDPKKRYAVNQDAEVQILAFAGNMTMNGRKFQGKVWAAA